MLCLLSLLDALCPTNCAACDAPAEFDGLCFACGEEVPNRLSPMAAPPDSVRSGWFLGPYAGPVGALVKRAKYGRQDALLRVIGERVGRAAGALHADVIIPVPSTHVRRMTRGFDAPDIIAAAVSRSTGVPVLHALTRTRHEAQAGHAHADRAANARRGWLATREIRGRVLLIDDVLTTGSTARACADELIGAGARRVDLLVAAATSSALDARVSKNFDNVGEIERRARA